MHFYVVHFSNFKRSHRIWKTIKLCAQKNDVDREIFKKHKATKQNAPFYVAEKYAKWKP